MMLRPYVDNPSVTRRSARDRVPYVAPAKRADGLEIPASAVCKIDSYAGKVVVLAQPDEDSMGCSRLVVMPQHPVDTDDQVRVAHIPITPVPVYYDPAAVNGPPVVGSILGTVEASWKLSTDRQGWRAMWVEEHNERVWVLPDHNWGTWDEPFNGADVDEWFRPDHMDFKYEGVEFEALIRPVGGSGAGVWVPFVYDTHGHLVMINRGAGTPTPSGGTTAPATTPAATTDGGGTTSVAPGGFCDYSSVTLTIGSVAECLTNAGFEGAGTYTLTKVNGNRAYGDAGCHFVYVNGATQIYFEHQSVEADYDWGGLVPGDRFKTHAAGSFDLFLVYGDGAGRSISDATINSKTRGGYDDTHLGALSFDMCYDISFDCGCGGVESCPSASIISWNV